MPARLFCKTGELAGASYPIDKEATIGRASGNTIVLHPSIVSSQHAHIIYEAQEDAYFIHDLGSRNGTKVDGVPVNGRVRLSILHIITFSDELDFIFQVLPVPGSKAIPKPAAPKPAAAAPPPPPQPAAPTPAAPRPPAPSQPAAPMQPVAPHADAPEDSSGSHTVFGLDFDALPSFDEVAEESEEGSTQRISTASLIPDLPELEEPSLPDLTPDPEPKPTPTPPANEGADADEEEMGPRTFFWNALDALPSLNPDPSEAPEVEPDPSGGVHIKWPESQPKLPASGAIPDFPSMPEIQPVAEPERPRDSVYERAYDEEDIHTVFSWGSFAFEFQKGDIEQQYFDLKPGDTTVGRRRDNDIPIPHHSISRLHAIFRLEGDTVSIIDCGSKNHTIVNGERLEPQVPHPLAPGSTVRFGPQFEGILHYK